MLRLNKAGHYETYMENRFAEENAFRLMSREALPLPDFHSTKSLLPSPFWEGHESVLSCYWSAWELAFTNLRMPVPESGFVANFVDTAFNDCLFMWDSAFILAFGRYGRRAFDFQRTLDNLYAKQHADGFICREIGTFDGLDRFERFDPASTGPNAVSWSEWEHYMSTSDRERLSRVFPVLVAYHQWLRAYRTWPNGMYWASGLASGMDNLPRFPKKAVRKGLPERLLYHGHLVWMDTCAQQALSAELLLRMADVLGRREEVEDMQKEREWLASMINEFLWDEKTAFYYDERPGGELSGVKTVGAYWGLLAGVVPESRVASFTGHLEDPIEFDRPHRVPSLSADHPEYSKDGGYWLGGVWPPTNYVVLGGLERVGCRQLAHEIARNDLEEVTRVFERTETLWENYSPEKAEPGNPAKRDFVGWGGLAPIAGLLEYVFGLCAEVPSDRLVWNVRLLEEHGVRRYPFGRDAVVDLHCAARSSARKEPQIRVNSNVALELVIRWEEGERCLQVRGR